MSTIPAQSPPVPVQLLYSFQFGPVIRESGKSRPASLDAIARDHGRRAVDLMLETPGHWVGIEPGPSSVKTEIAAIERQTATITQAREQIQQLARQPIETPRLPDVHPGTPGNATIGLICRVVKRTDRATLIELAEDPRGQAWVALKHVRPGDPAHAFRCELLHFPLWLYRKVREQL